MTTLYFTDYNKPAIARGEAPLPDNVLASFAFPAGSSELLARYLLTPDLQLIDRFSGLTDAEAEKKIEEEYRRDNPKLVDAVAFKLRFTPDERVAIYNSDDHYVKDFLRILDDVRLLQVDLNLDDTLFALGRLAELGLITESRQVEILNSGFTIAVS